MFTSRSRFRSRQLLTVFTLSYTRLLAARASTFPLLTTHVIVFPSKAFAYPILCTKLYPPYKRRKQLECEVLAECRIFVKNILEKAFAKLCYMREEKSVDCTARKYMRVSSQDKIKFLKNTYFD